MRASGLARPGTAVATEALECGGDVCGGHEVHQTAEFGLIERVAPLREDDATERHREVRKVTGERPPASQPLWRFK